MKAPAGLSLGHFDAETLCDHPREWWDGVLGVVSFGAAGRGRPVAASGVPGVHVPTRAPAAAENCEVWRSGDRLATGASGAIRYRTSESLMFGSLEIDETDPVFATDRSASPLQCVTRSAYRQLFELLDDTGYPTLLRIWNYFPAINAEHGGTERYWQFNAGRQDAFLAGGRPADDNVPAASALGACEGRFALCFLASRGDSLAIENPRQTSAYHYPEQYGPRRPLFARASLAQLHGAPLLFVSGTASIVGHRTLHHGDAAAQTVETLRNIDAVLAEARRVAPATALHPADLTYKIYVRHVDDIDAVRAVFRQYAGDDVSAIFVQADICRGDLLVEIECSGKHAVERVAEGEQ